MANYDEEQEKGESGLDRAGEEAKRYAGDKAKEKLSGKGAKEGAKETGKDTAKQVAKEGGKKAGKEGIKRGAQAATAPETAGIGPAVIEAADQAQQAVRDPEKAVKKGGMVAILGIGAVITSVIAVLFVVVGVPIIIIAIILGAIEIAEADPDEPSSVLSVTKTANPKQFPNGAEGVGSVFKEVTYTVTISNTGADPVKDIAISDDCGTGGELVGSITSPDEIAAGATESIIYKCKIRTDPPAYNDRYHINTFRVDGSVAGSGGETTNLDYDILFRDTSINVVDEDIKKSQVTSNPNWPSNFVNTECESGVSCWDYVKQVAVTGGVNPVFVLAVWIAESGASHFSGHLSCPNGGIGLSHTVADLKLSVDCFVDLANNFSSGQFASMIDQFCDPATPEICQEPPAPVKTFLASLKSWYETLVPQGNPGAMTTASSATIQISNSATARVKIGNPPSGPPAYDPMKGLITCSGYDFWETFDSATTPCAAGSHPTHRGMDVVSGNIDIFSPFEGSATVFFIGDQDVGSGCSLCPGIWIELTSEDSQHSYKARLLHLKRDSIPDEIQMGVIVETDQKLAEMGNTGTSSGAHLHYEIYVDGVPVDPKDYNVFTPHP